MAISTVAEKKPEQSVAQASLTDLRKEEFVHEIEPELTNSHLPRCVRLEKEYARLRSLLIGLAILTTGMPGLVGYADCSTWNALIDHGVVATAKVHYKEVLRRKKKRYALYYHFQTTTGVVSKRRYVSSAAYKSTPVGAQWTVTYLPRSPDVSKWQFGLATTERRNKRALCWSAIVMGLTIFWTMASKGLIQSGNKQVRLLRKGSATRAVVTGFRPTEAPSSGLQWVDYTYFVQGQPHSGQFTAGMSGSKNLEKNLSLPCCTIHRCRRSTWCTNQ